jgi:hypothetical protein
MMVAICFAQNPIAATTIQQTKAKIPSFSNSFVELGQVAAPA